MGLYEDLRRLNDAQLATVLDGVGDLAAYVKKDTVADTCLGLKKLAEQRDETRLRIEALVRRVTGERGAIDVAIVAVEAELHADVQRVRDLLNQRQAQVRSVRVVSPAECGPGPSIVLVGAAIDGVEGARRVKARLDEGALGLRRFPPAPEDYAKYAADLAHSAPLIGRCRDLADLRPAVVAWLDAQVPRGAAALAPWEEDYLRRSVSGWIRGMHTALVNRHDRTALRRADLYVALPVEQGAAWWDERGRLRSGAPDQGRGKGGDAVPEPVRRAYVDELVSRPDHRLSLLLGEAGSGKTVTALHLAAAFAAPHLAGALDPDEAAGLAKVEAQSRLAQPPRALPLIPLFLEARQFTTGEALLRGIEGFDGDAHALLSMDRYILIVDSLDEVPTLARRKAVLIELASIAAGGTRVILTSRPGAHTRVDVPKAYRVLPLAPLEDDTRGEMVDRWAAAQGYDERRRGDLALAVQELSGRFDAGADAPLVANPLLLTCIFLVYQEGHGRLPDNAADLYRRMVDILCDTRAPQPDEARARPDDPEGRRLDSAQVRFTHAAALAWAMQERGTAVPLDVLAAALKADASLGFADLAAARSRIEQIVTTTAIFRTVEEKGVIQVRPWHRSFQEYLAAVRFARQAGGIEERMATLSPRVADPSWRGCLGFVIGALGQVQPDHAQAAVRAWLGEDDADARTAGARLAMLAEAVAEYRPECFDGQGALLDELGRRGLERFARDGADWSWRDRVGMLEALGRLGLDQRWPDPTVDPGGWVLVPAFEGVLGGDGDAFHSLPARSVSVPPGWILHRPVTVGDYARFVDEGGYDDPSWWIEPVTLDPSFSAQRRWPNRPVVNVSWIEAEAFCRWASQRWRVPGTGLVDLPTSTEWEQAVRASGGVAYPWGNEAHSGNAAEANFAWDGSPGRPTPVGAFPGGDLQMGRQTVHDLAGNVWEWTRTEWVNEAEEREVVGVDFDTSTRWVLRGGSWIFPLRDLRCAARSWDQPSGRYSFIGFRLVFRPSSTVGP